MRIHARKVALLDESAQHRLIEDNLQLVDIAVNQTHGTWRSLERDDIKGAAFIGLVNAARTYDPAGKTTFTLWARHKIRYEILEYISKEYVHLTKTVQFDPQIEKEVVKPVFKIVQKVEQRNIPTEDALCAQCEHLYAQHHEVMGCMYWDRRLKGSGFCVCDGFRVRLLT